MPYLYYHLTKTDTLYNKENWPNSEEERKKIFQEKYLIRTFNLLNNLGKKEALKRIEELVLVPKYVDEEGITSMSLIEKEKKEHIDKKDEVKPF